jgi:hypothetical protein
MSPTGVHCQRHGWTHVSDISKENWETADTHETHMHTPHLDDFAGRLDDLLDGSLAVARVRRMARAISA